MPFINPVFREGCTIAPNIGKNFTKEQSNLIGRELEKATRKLYMEPLLSYLEENNIQFNRWRREGMEKAWIRYQHTPIVTFPPANIKISNLSFVFRESLTVCVADSLSKIWTSVSYYSDDLTNEVNEDELYGICQIANEFCSTRLSSFLKCYEGVVKKVCDTSEFGDFESSEIELNKGMAISIYSLGTRVNINDLLHSSLIHGKDFIVKHAEDPSFDLSFLQSFYNLSETIGNRHRNDMDHSICNVIPIEFDREEKSAHLPSQQHLHEPRNALVVGFRQGNDKEQYLSIGYDSPDWQSDPKYRNSNCVSRSIMMEVGNAF